MFLRRDTQSNNTKASDLGLSQGQLHLVSKGAAWPRQHLSRNCLGTSSVILRDAARSVRHSTLFVSGLSEFPFIRK